MSAAQAGGSAPRTKLITTITRAEPPLDLQAYDALRRGADLVELRVDCIQDIPAIEQFLRSPGRPPCVLTIRPSREMGEWDADEAERIALIERLGLLQPGFIDIELSTWNASANIRQKIDLVARNAGQEQSGRPRNELIMSRHAGPLARDDLAQTLAELRATPARIVKLAFEARDARDALAALKLVRDRAGSPTPNAQRKSRTRLGEQAPVEPAPIRVTLEQQSLILVALGPAGLASRVLAPKFGAFATYAAAHADAPGAPGQPSLHDLLDVYHWKSITPATHVYGVVGWPLTHSLSPHVHNAAMRAAGIDGVYVPFPVSPTSDALDSFLDYVDENEWLDIRGLSVTAPHKENALAWLQRRGGTFTSDVRRGGALNTLTRSESGRWHAANTDAAALLAGLDQLIDVPRDQWASLHFEILGAGGAACTAATCLLRLGASVILCARNEQRAAQAAARFGCQSRPWHQRGLPPARVVINCTPLGSGELAGQTPLETSRLPPEMRVFDMVYNPAPSRLVAEALAAGRRAMNGAEMFLSQASDQFRLWHETNPPDDVMRAAFNRSVGRQ